jgi:hypothetical protein
MRRNLYISSLLLRSQSLCLQLEAKPLGTVKLIFSKNETLSNRKTVNEERLSTAAGPRSGGDEAVCVYVCVCVCDFCRKLKTSG